MKRYFIKSTTIIAIPDPGTTGVIGSLTLQTHRRGMMRECEDGSRDSPLGVRVRMKYTLGVMVHAHVLSTREAEEERLAVTAGVCSKTLTPKKTQHNSKDGEMST